MLLIILLSQTQLLSGQTLKDILKLKLSVRRAVLKNYALGVDMSNIADSEPLNQLSSSQWSIHLALHHCLLIRHGSNYKAYIHGALLCFTGYYKFCMQENAAVRVKKLTSQYAPECMRVRFSEPVPSRNARIWDIHVPLGFHINLTVIDLQMTYHPLNLCLGNMVQEGRYTGQGVAIGNYTTICERTKHHSYLIPANRTVVILNYTHIPDCPVLDFLYEAIIPQKPMKSYLTLLKLSYINVLYFDFFRNTKRCLILLYIKTWVKFSVSLLNVTLVCENNVQRGKILYFIDGSVVLLASYLRSYAIITSLDCENVAPSATSTSLVGNNSGYLYMEEVKASIGDLTVVMDGPDKDMSVLNFGFRSIIPDTPYGHLNLTDYTHKKPENNFQSILANLKLPVQGRHFHIMYWLQRQVWAFQAFPRLVFQIEHFDMVSFRDRCHTGGIFIIEESTTIARYCSQAGIAFLNTTTETGGLLFGISPLVLILKGYSWFANIQLKISISYDSCLGVTNICDKMRDAWPLLPTKCDTGDGIPCRYVMPKPCLEIVQLPSDDLRDYSQKCKLISHIDRSPATGYINFANTVVLTFAIKGQLELREAFPVIYPNYIVNRIYVPMLYPRLQLNKKYTLQGRSIITNIKNTYPWLGIGHWIRLVQIPGCQRQTVNLQPLEPLRILSTCGELAITSVIRYQKIMIHNPVPEDFLYYNFLYLFLHIAIFLPEAHETSSYTAGMVFNATLQWSSDDGFQKRITYTKRQYLEVKLLSQYSYQNLSIDLEWSRSLNHLHFVYTERQSILGDKTVECRKHAFETRGISVEQPEVCFQGILSCYCYHESDNVMLDITWNMAQARCAEHNSNLISINTPEEWQSLLEWAYNFHRAESVRQAHISGIAPFKGRLLFLGQHLMDVSTDV